MPRIDISAFGERPGSVTVPGPDPARDARVDAYRDRERRRAARLLDRYLEVAYEVSGHNLPLDGSLRLNAAGDRFVEAVGDYVLSRLQQKSHYDVSDDLPDVPPCAERGADVGPEVITTTDRDHALHVQNRDPVSWCRQCVGPFFDV
jgi:hypothetical protein